MKTFTMKRLSLVIEPEPGNAKEAGGILNPAATRGPDGELYLFPRLVAAGNYSRVGIARVEFDKRGEPIGIERLGVALEPEAPYELRPNGEGGCEDPRVTYVEPLACYIMTYTAFSPEGPRIALAMSKDLLKWERLGLATFQPYEGIHFNGIDNKDACMFPVAIPNPTRHKELAILHRPLFPGTAPEENLARDANHDVDLHRESIWISYSPPGSPDQSYELREFTSHDRLAAPVSPWESLKIGSGCPPIMCKHGWLFIYHGVADVQHANGAHQIRYSAGVMVLSAENPQELRYRTTHPALVPQPSTGPRGTPSDVVFPSGVDRRDDIGQPDRFDVYFGMNDFRIGVARMDVPDVLPHPGVADPVTVATS